MLRLDINLVFTIVNLLVLYFLLKKFLIQPVMNIMNQRQTLIEQSMDQARVSEEKAAQLKEQYEEKLKASDEEAAKIVAAAREDARVCYDRIVKEAGEQSARIIDHAHKTADADQEKAMREAEAQIAGLVIAAAAKVVQKEVSEKSNRALYDMFLAEAGDSHDAGSN